MEAIVRAPFRIGLKEVYLPNFTVTLIRSPRLPPTMASFIVPLNMNKLDMRDYLYHAYNVKSISVRSFIKQERVEQGGKRSAVRPVQKRWYRPRATKKMTVEMDKPFVFPKEPEDYEAFDQKRYEAAGEANKKYEEMRGRLSDAKFDKDDMERMREQAKALLEGKARWKGKGRQDDSL